MNKITIERGRPIEGKFEQVGRGSTTTEITKSNHTNRSIHVRILFKHLHGYMKKRVELDLYVSKETFLLRVLMSPHTSLQSLT